MEEALRADVKKRIGGDEQRVHSMDVNYSALTYKHILLPVWILAYRYSDKPYRVVVNATTGSVHGERPWSPVKIGLAIFFALLVGAGIWYASQRAQHGGTRSQPRATPSSYQQPAHR
jgi:hypothetical protein